MNTKRVGKKLVFFLFIILPLFFSSLAFSDDFQKVEENILKNFWKKIGFVYFEPSLLIQEVGYHSNLFFYENRRVPDWTADVGLNIKASTLIGK